MKISGIRNCSGIFQASFSSTEEYRQEIEEINRLADIARENKMYKAVDICQVFLFGVDVRHGCPGC